jgi:GTP-binding protein
MPEKTRKSDRIEKSAQPQRPVPIVAIIGRPNVGKSTLFNRLISRRLAITSKIPGTTRDRIYYRTDFDGIEAVLVDTGGLEYGKKEDIEADVQAQIHLAIEEADLIFFVVDAHESLVISDYEAADLLRKSGKKVLLVANKIDASASQANIMELTSLGFGEAAGISAYHNTGIDSLIEEASAILRHAGFRKHIHEETKPQALNICFLGKPNVGKSSLVNAILGKPKIIVSHIPGTTRDTIDTEITLNGHLYNLIDTAGLRRRGRIERGLEKLSSFRSLDAIERSDVVCLILDYAEGVRKQDQHIASYILEAGKGLILIVNKIDLMKERENEENAVLNILRRKFEFTPWAPVIFVSALRKSNIEKILEIASRIQDERFMRLDDDELAGFMKETIYKHLPPAQAGRLTKFRALTQVSVNPPTFAFKVNNPSAINFSYRRYLENELRKRWPFTGTPVKIFFDRV